LDGLKWAYDQKLPFAAKVDRLALGNRLECNLRHERLGTWVGEFTIAPSATPDRLAPLQVVYALVVIEPLEESPAPAKPTPVEQK